MLLILLGLTFLQRKVVVCEGLFCCCLRVLSESPAECCWSIVDLQTDIFFLSASVL